MVSPSQKAAFSTPRLPTREWCWTSNRGDRLLSHQPHTNGVSPPSPALSERVYTSEIMQPLTVVEESCGYGPKRLKGKAVNRSDSGSLSGALPGSTLFYALASLDHKLWALTCLRNSQPIDFASFTGMALPIRRPKI